MAKLTSQQQLDRITTWLTSVLGSRLQALVLYGSAAGSEPRGHRSDHNLLAVVDAVSAGLLDDLAPAQLWWAKQGNPPVVVLSQDEQKASCDVFPIEYLDIQRQHRLLAGADVFSVISSHPELHRLQVEHDLRTQLIRLRSNYALVRQYSRRLESLLLDSISTFLVLFRHALVAAGEPWPASRGEALAAAARRFQFSSDACQTLLAAHRNHGHLPKTQLHSLFAQYLDSIQRVERGLEELA